MTSNGPRVKTNKKLLIGEEKMKDKYGNDE